MDEHAAQEHVQNVNRFFFEKGEINLKVKLNSTEDADQILQWMYLKEGPMKSELLEVSWDKVYISKEIAEALAPLVELAKEGRLLI